MLDFVQINLHKASTASLLAGQLLEQRKQKVLMLTEPYTVQSKVVNMPKNTTLIYDRKCSKDGHPPRAAIAASPDLRVNSMDSWCNRDCAVGLVNIHGRQTALVSIYLDITKPVVQPWLEELMDMITRKKLPVILCLDSNAHSDLFGPDTNARGEALEDFILGHNLYTENLGDAPTFELQRGGRLIQTHIDVTLSRDLHFVVDDWRVDRSYNASDHNTILFKCAPIETTTQMIRPWSKADWPLFTNELKQAQYRIPEDMSMKKLDKLTAQMYQLIDRALDRACPKIEVDNTARKNVWSTDKHDLAKTKVSALYTRAKRAGLETDWAIRG